MPLKIHQDHSRFKQIVRGKIKANLRKYVQKGEMIGKKGKDLISIPIPFIDIPHFKYGHKEQGGVGQGEGEVGQPLAPGAVAAGDGTGKAGQGEGEHALEVDVSLDELAQILGEELQLPQHRAARATRRSSPRRSSTPASTPPGPSRCATSSAPTSRR